MCLQYSSSVETRLRGTRRNLRYFTLGDGWHIGLGYWLQTAIVIAIGLASKTKVPYGVMNVEQRQLIAEKIQEHDRSYYNAHAQPLHPIPVGTSIQ